MAAWGLKGLRRVRPGLVPALLIAVVAWLAYGFVDRTVKAGERRRFDQEVSRVMNAIQERLQAYRLVIDGGRGLYAGSDTITAREFGAFAAQFQLTRLYPGIQGLGFAEWVRPDELAAHEARLHAEGTNGYEVWPVGDREGFAPVTHLFPPDRRNLSALGYDMFSEPARRVAMERARDTGQPVATDPVVLVQEGQGSRSQPGFLIYAPVYHPPAPTTLEERRERLRGFVYAPFRTHDLLGSIVREQGPLPVDFAVFSGEDTSSGTLLFARQATDEPRRPPKYVTDMRLLVAGQPWTVRFESSVRLVDEGSRALPPVVALCGALLALLVFSTVQAQVRARARAETSAARSSFLAHAASELGRTLDEQSVLAMAARLPVPHWARVCEVTMRLEDGSLVTHSSDTPELPRAPLPDEDVRMPERTIRLDRSSPFDAKAEWLEPLNAYVGPDGRFGVLIAAPIRLRGEVHGRLLLVQRAGASHPLDADLADGLARLIAAAVDNARHYLASRRAVQARDEFMSIASHELRTPLTSLQLHLQKLRRDAGRGVTEIPNRTLRALDAIERQTSRLTGLVNSLLDLSRIAHGRLDVSLERTDIAALVRDVVSKHEEDAALAACPIDLRVEPLVGVTDHLRLEQVVTNLLSNALKYGKGRPVHVTLSREGADALLEVRDEGIGIPAEAVERIFGRFERAVSSRHYGGLGLGLYIVRQIVDALGGQIDVSSPSVGGACFRVRLPVDAQAEAQQA